ncbi:hypothetical protein [Mesobacillus harenae]|uniref:hypothetical protein n=1 Tax=Mesobacillus harenae TaxID=2213203 RepID=UPI00158066DD|nr:hypothetical protein [Mesobacillus harenae]
MFGMDDFIKFLQAFFIVFPVVTLIHLAGHITFASIFGGKDLKVKIGSGKRLFSIGFVEVRWFYFWFGDCEYGSLKVKNRGALSLVFLGGALFNLLSIFFINLLIAAGWADKSMLTYQFVYFSFYYMFFAMLPMDFQDGYPSDGKAILRLWKRQRESNCSSSDCVWKAN